MIGTLARTRTNAAALAVLAALAVALFAVMHSASADGHEHITVTINDSDNVIGDNQEVTLTVTVNNVPTYSDGESVPVAPVGSPPMGGYSYRFVAIPSGLPTIAGSRAEVFSTVDGTTSNSGYKFFVPEGTTGEFSIGVSVARAASERSTGTSSTESFAAFNLDGSVTFTVGDPGDPIASAEVVVGNENHATGEGAVADSATSSKGQAGKIAVTVNVLNSLGNAPNDDEVHDVHLFAPLAQVSEADDLGMGGIEGAAGSGTKSVTDATPSTNFYVEKASAGTVDVYAIVIGEGGSATSAPLTLTFTGDADAVMLGAADSPLSTNYVPKSDGMTCTTGREEGDECIPRDATTESGHATVALTAVDSSGNEATLTVVTADGGGTSVEGLTLSVVDADGDAADDIMRVIQEDPETKAVSIKVHVAEDKDVEPGEYTLNATFGDNDPVSTPIVVAGPSHTVELSTEWGDHNILTVSATVTDEGGNLLPDAGMVDFQAVGSLELRALGAGASGGGVSGTLDDGMTSVRFVAIGDTGSSTVIASIDGVDGVVMVALDGGDDGTMVSGPSLSDLSRTSGLSSYSGSDTTASSLMALLVGRASAVWLSTGEGWVLYASVDGAMVPGSSDFAVTSGDVLYISN